MEQRQLVRMSDVGTLRFSCKECGAGLMLRVDNIDEPPVVCPGCRRQWMVAKDADHNAIYNLVRSLRTLRANPSGVTYQLEFELAAPPAVPVSQVPGAV